MPLPKRFFNKSHFGTIPLAEAWEKGKKLKFYFSFLTFSRPDSKMYLYQKSPIEVGFGIRYNDRLPFEG